MMGEEGDWPGGPTEYDELGCGMQAVHSRALLIAISAALHLCPSDLSPSAFATRIRLRAARATPPRDRHEARLMPYNRVSCELALVHDTQCGNKYSGCRQSILES